MGRLGRMKNQVSYKQLLNKSIVFIMGLLVGVICIYVRLRLLFYYGGSLIFRVV